MRSTSLASFVPSRTIGFLGLLGVIGLAGLANVGCKRSCNERMFAASNSGDDRGGSDSAKGFGAEDNGAPSAGGRAVSEADIVQYDQEGQRIYAMSKSGTLSIVNASQPGILSLSGKTALPGVPFEMYRLGNVLLVMSNGAVGPDGAVLAPRSEGAEPPAVTDASGAIVQAVDISDPTKPTPLDAFPVPGQIADSRVVGHVLYLATYESSACHGCATTARTLVTTFDVADPLLPKQVDQVAFEGPANADLNFAWSTPWKRSIAATASHLYVGGLASDASTTTDEGVIEVLDITDPTGHLTRGATITTAGPVMSRWQMDEADGYLRVVSQRGAGRTSNGEAYPDVDTFRIESSSSYVRTGHMTLELPRQEGLKTVRFDGVRAYAITFNQTDPLFTIDLSDPAKPAQKGELHMPGWVYHLEPRGERLVGLGLDRADATGNLNVTLFDVADLTNPKLLTRASFGPTHMYEDYQITNGVMAEDQDRIQKAFRVFEDGLVVVPYSDGKNLCAGVGGGVQLLRWDGDVLNKQAMLPMSGNARRALRRETDTTKEIIALSDSNITAFDIRNEDVVAQTADLVIGQCVPRDQGGYGGGDWGGDDYGGGGGRGGYDVTYGRCD